MVQYIQGPDGKVLEFPDGMSREDMAGAMDARYASAPGESPARPDGQYVGPGRGLALAGQALARGAVGTLGFPGDLTALGTKYVENPIRNYFGLAPATGQALPTSADIQAGLDRVGLGGLTHSPSLVPTTSAERYGTGILEALGPSLVGKGQLAYKLANAAGSGIGAEAGADLTDGSAWGRMAGGVLGGLGVAGGVYRATRNADIQARQTTLNSARNSVLAAEGKYKAAQAEKTAVQDSLISQAEANRNAIQTGAATGRGMILDSLGGPRTEQQAGTQAQQAAQNWVSNVAPALHREAWAPVDALIPNTTPTPFTHFTQAVSDISSRGGSIQPLLDQVTPRLPRTLNNSILTSRNQVNAMRELGVPEGEIPPVLGEGASWREAQQMRSAIGDALSDPSIAKDASRKQLDTLYKAISDDMRDAAHGAGGPAAVAAFEQANGTAQRLHSVAQDVMGKLTTSGNPAQEQVLPAVAAHALLSGRDATPLATLREYLPEAADALLAGHITNSPHDWHTLSPEAQNALAGSPALSQVLSDLNRGHHSAEDTFKTAVADAKNTAASEVSKAKTAKDAAVLQELEAEKQMGIANKLSAKKIPELSEAHALSLGGGLEGSRAGLGIFLNAMGHDLGTWGSAFTNTGMDVAGHALQSGAGLGLAAGAAAYTLPRIVNAGKTFATHPELWQYPAQGAAGASAGALRNPLVP